MNDTITIAVIAGTTREGRESIKAARFVAEYGSKRPGVKILFVDPMELDLPHDGDDVRDPRYSEITKQADAFYVVTPEYNHSFPGSLKRLLDSEHDNYAHKPIATAGVSSGPWGGARACEALLSVYHTLALIAVKPEVYFPLVKTLFDENGRLLEEHRERYETNLGKAFDELEWFVRKLR